MRLTKFGHIFFFGYFVSLSVYYQLGNGICENHTSKELFAFRSHASFAIQNSHVA